MIMSENLKLMSALLFCASALLISQNTLAAETCATVPTCAELGYTKTDCGNFISLKCPFDKTKMFCGRDECESGYNYNSSTGKCQKISPNVVYVNGEAIGVKVNSKFAIALTDEGVCGGTCASALCGKKTTGGKKWRMPTQDEQSEICDKDNDNKKFLSVDDDIASVGGERIRPSSYFSAGASDERQIGILFFSSCETFDSAKAPVSGGNGAYVRCVFDLE